MWQGVVCIIHGEILTQYRGLMIYKHHLFMSWKQHVVTYRRYGKIIKIMCKEYVGSSNQMLAFEEMKKNL